MRCCFGKRIKKANDNRQKYEYSSSINESENSIKMLDLVDIKYTVDNTSINEDTPLKLIDAFVFDKVLHINDPVCHNDTFVLNKFNTNLFNTDKFDKKKHNEQIEKEQIRVKNIFYNEFIKQKSFIM
jgi:hypothetical protein